MPESEAWRVHSCSTVSVIVQGTGKDNDHRYTLYAEKDSRSEAGIRTSHDNLFVRSTAKSLNHRKTKQNQTSKARISQDSDTPDSHSQDGNMQSRRPQPVKTDTINMAIWSRRIQSRWQFGQDAHNQDGDSHDLIPTIILGTQCHHPAHGACQRHRKRRAHRTRMQLFVTLKTKTNKTKTKKA